MAHILPRIALFKTPFEGSKFWRVLNPLKHIPNEKIMLPDPMSQEWRDTAGTITTEIDPVTRALDAADILFAHNPPALLYDFLLEYRNLRSIGSLEGVCTPIRYVFDYDDDPFSIPPTNLMYGVFGLDDVKTIKDGEEVYLWKDGEEYPGRGANGVPLKFDIDQNMKNRLGIVSMIRLADVITTTTREMYNRLKQYRPNEDNNLNDINIFPNAVDASIFYDPREHDDEDDYENPARDEVKILWTMSTSHLHDFGKLRPALGQALRENAPYAHLYVMGDRFGVGRDIPLSQITFIPWVKTVSGYAETIRNLRPDIGICYVEDTEFNLAKSTLKWQEMTAIGAATVCSKALYGDYLLDGRDTVLASSPDILADKLSLLIKDEKLRHTLHANSDNYIRENYALHKQAGSYMALFQKLVNPNTGGI